MSKALSNKTKLQNIVSVFDFMTAAQIADVQAGTLTLDCAASINAANTYLASRPRGGTLWFPNGAYPTLSGITIPAYVNWMGESAGWNSGTNQLYGVVIYKQHTSDAITFNKTIAGGQYCENICIRGRNGTDIGGSGFVITTASDVVLRRCNVFGVYNHSFVIGNGSATCYSCVLDDCYSNGPFIGSNFVINSTLFEGQKMISDGGLWGATFSSVATNWSMGEFHFEGFTTGGMSIANSQGKTYGKGYMAGTNATGLTGVLVNGSASGITLTGFQIAFNAVRAGSIGLSLAGSATSIAMRDSTIASAEIGVSDVSGGANQATLVEGVIFNTCTKGIYTSANYTKYLNNKFVGSTTYDIEHIGGTGGLWQGNLMSLTGDNAFKPTFSGQSGNFNKNAVKDNAGYVTRNSGYVASAASGTPISHGLAAAPLQNGSVITLTPHGSGLTSPIITQSPGATTFTPSWAGTTPIPLTWEARLVCDF
jgi:hypothetical protein